MTKRVWTDEQKAQQSAAIQRWKPWTKSTGARTPEGKAIVSQNVRVGQRRRQAAIEQAMQELNAAKAKVLMLTGCRR